MQIVHPDIESAYKVLEGGSIDRELAGRLANLDGVNIPDLASLANKIRAKFAPEDHVCSILNAKSGRCEEDCRYCAQSAHHSAASPIFPLISVERIATEAQHAYNDGVRRFGIVTSGLGYNEINGELEQIVAAVDVIRGLFSDMEVCASLGVLSEQTAEFLARHGLSNYNHNLQVNPPLYDKLVSSTHNVSDRIETLKLLKQNGISICAGGIIGLGETMDDRVNLAFALKDLGVKTIPLNVLVPIEGTPMEKAAAVPPAEVVKTFAIFRLINPSSVIKFAAGRETVMKDWQGAVMLAGANGILTGGYLTTRGRETDEDGRLITDLKAFR